MNNSMEKTIKKLKSKSILGHLILCILSLIGSAFLITILIAIFVAIIINTRYDGALHQTAVSLEKIEKEHATGRDYDSILKEIQLQEKRPLSISVAGGEEVIAHYGEMIDLKNDNIIELEEGNTLNIRFTNKDVVEKKDVDEIYINTKELVQGFVNGSKDRKAIEDSVEDTYALLEKEIYTLCYWVKSVGETKETIYVKNELSLYWKDCLEICVFAGILGVIFVISCIGSFIRTISDIISQRYYIKLLLSDPVTGGSNSFAFESVAFKNLTSVFNRMKGYAIIDLSLDKYQNYCTLYGVDSGERLLIGIEKSISKYLSRGEMVSRVSGADFLVLLRTSKNVPDEDALVSKAREIIDYIPNIVAGIYNGANGLSGLDNLHFKSGLYYISPAVDEETRKRRNKNTLNVKNLCIKAGIAKSSITEDSGLVIYNHDMWEKEVWERKVEDMMQDALDNEEFQVYIQPKYNPSTEELMGGEALVRWISPTEGFISPGQFIPIFERTGFVTKLDDYMISHTAKLQADWFNEGKKVVPVSVNVSRAHFAMPDLAEHIRDLVDKYSLPHKYIEIELTESAFFDDKKALLSTVNRLQEYGFEVSMDDFGSGYSSLNSLKDLPLNVLKLDADFFRGEGFEGRGEIVVSKAIALAKQLNMRIVAEGVEKKEQVDFLAGQDCDMIQGFYFAKPMPAAEYAERMK